MYNGVDLFLVSKCNCILRPQHMVDTTTSTTHRDLIEHFVDSILGLQLSCRGKIRPTMVRGRALNMPKTISLQPVTCLILLLFPMEKNLYDQLFS